MMQTALKISQQHLTYNACTQTHPTHSTFGLFRWEVFKEEIIRHENGHNVKNLTMVKKPEKVCNIGQKRAENA